MVKVLFICHGNICRSPMAEYLLRDMVRRQGLAAQFQIASAATSREEIGNDVYPPARAELRAHGVPVGHRAAVQVTPRDYDDYDWLLTMDENNARNLRRILPHDPDGKIRSARWTVTCVRLWKAKWAVCWPGLTAPRFWSPTTEKA